MAKDDKQQDKQEMQKAQPTRTLSPFEEMERLFEGYLPRGWMHPFFHLERPSWGELTAPFEGRMPRVDIVEHDEEIVVKAELPGVDKKDLDVSVTENSVTIKGSSSQEEKEQKGDYYRSEISRGTYSRTLTLPSDVAADKAKAKFKDGVLELTLPKLKKAKRHSIKVS